MKGDRILNQLQRPHPFHLTRQLQDQGFKGGAY